MCCFEVYCEKIQDYLPSWMHRSRGPASPWFGSTSKGSPKVRRESGAPGSLLRADCLLRDALRANCAPCEGLLVVFLISNMQERRGFRPMSTLTEPEFSELSPQGHKSVEGKFEQRRPCFSSAFLLSDFVDNEEPC